MKQNTFISFGILALLVLSLSAVSAALVPSQATINLAVGQGNSASSSFTIYNNDLVNNATVSLSLSGNNSAVNAALSQTSFNLTNNTNSSAITLSVSAGSNLAVGNYIFNINGASSPIVVTVTVTQSMENRICGSRFNSSIAEITSINDNEIDNENEWEWKPLDDIEIEARVENIADDDYEYDIELVFYSGTSVYDELADDEDNLVIEGYDINEGDRETLTFNFQVSGEVEEDNYDMYVKVTRDDGQCFVVKADSAEINKQSQQVLVKTLDGPITSSCGETIELTAEVANIGSSDEDRVKVILYNRELGINTYKEVDNLDSGETATVNFMFTVPSTAVQKIYSMVLSTAYDYDDKNDEYDEQSDSDDDYVYKLNLIDGCVDPARPTISATLDNSAQVGEDFNITITVKNNANSSNSFLMTAEGYENWASEAVFAPSAFNVAKQATQTVTLTLSPTQSGSKTFTLKTVYNGKTVEQTVSLNIASKQESAISNYFANLKDGNVTSWLITGIVVLALLILIVLLLRLLL
jgi:hypothetical protein